MRTRTRQSSGLRRLVGSLVVYGALFAAGAYAQHRWTVSERVDEWVSAGSERVAAVTSADVGSEAREFVSALERAPDASAYRVPVANALGAAARALPEQDLSRQLGVALQSLPDSSAYAVVRSRLGSLDGAYRWRLAADASRMNLER